MDFRMWLALLTQLPARACSVFCPPVHDAGMHLPTDGEVDAPLDATPFVGGFPGELGLRDASGAPVQVEEIPRDDGLVQLVPAGELLPDTEYVVVDGETEVGSFLTGTGRSDVLDLLAPDPLGAVGEVHRPVIPSCGGRRGVWLEVDWPATTGVYEVRVVRPDGSRVDLVRTTSSAMLGSATCVDTVDDLVPGEVLEISVRSVGHAGGVSEWSEPLVTSAREAGGGCNTPGGHAGWLLVGLASLALRRART